MELVRFGGIGGFLTPNVADTRNPLVVVLHQGCVRQPEGGFTKEGRTEKFELSLLDEAPSMPSAARMLEMLAENPVAQSRFFILSMRLFLEHVLGVMSYDEQLRPNGSRNGVMHPDGCAAGFCGGSFGAIAQLHGPIEEQARLSCHPHIVLHFVHQTSQEWLRRVLQAEAEDAKAMLRRWQQQTLLAVESLMSSCAGLMKLQFAELPFPKMDLKPLPYLSKWQEEDKFDGELEGCRKDSEKRRALIPVQAPFIDVHVQRRLDSMEADGQGKKKEFSMRQWPLTGAVMSSLPHYRLLPAGFAGCACRVCEAGRQGKLCKEGDYAERFAEDLRGICALSGHLHEHQATCFKYAPEGSRKKPQHCRFNFVHFVKLFQEKLIEKRPASDASGVLAEEKATYRKLVEVTLARTGKEPVLPRWLASGLGTISLDGEHFEGRSELGSRVNASSDGTQRGRIMTVQYNPREGQCFPVPWRQMILCNSFSFSLSCCPCSCSIYNKYVVMIYLVAKFL